MTNNPVLIPDLFFSIEFESLLTDFHTVEEIEYSDNLDFHISVIDDDKAPLNITVTDSGINLSGSILDATRKASDLRFTLFGNEGMLFRYILMFLEKKYNVFSFHACSLYNENTNHIVIAPGGAGSGKTCLILKGLELGMKLFSTEMTHYSLENGLTLFKGSLIDNIRVGNLKYSYPLVTKNLNLKLPETDDEWGKKIPVNLKLMETPFDTISDTTITIVLPHIEERREECILVDIDDPRSARKALFDNLSDKIAETVLYYDMVPHGGFDNPSLMRKRFEAVDRLLPHIRRITKIIAGPQNCWEGILDRTDINE